MYQKRRKVNELIIHFKQLKNRVIAKEQKEEIMKRRAKFSEEGNKELIKPQVDSLKTLIKQTNLYRTDQKRKGTNKNIWNKKETYCECFYKVLYLKVKMKIFLKGPRISKTILKEKRGEEGGEMFALSNFKITIKLQ